MLFTTSFLNAPSNVSSTIDDRFAMTCCCLSGDRYEQFRCALTDLRGEYKSGSDDHRSIELLRQLLVVLLIRIERLQSSTDANRRSRELETLSPLPTRPRHLVRRDPTCGRVRDTARLLDSYSLKTLTRACQAATGHTAKELIDARVTLEAKRLLAHTDLPAATVGHRLGFAAPTGINKFFARQTRQTPGAFRRTHAS